MLGQSFGAHNHRRVDPERTGIDSSGMRLTQPPVQIGQNEASNDINSQVDAKPKKPHAHHTKVTTNSSSPKPEPRVDENAHIPQGCLLFAFFSPLTFRFASLRLPTDDLY